MSKPTNYEQIRQFSLEEMAQFMVNMVDCVSCRNKLQRSDEECHGDSRKCLDVTKKWLSRPAQPFLTIDLSFLYQDTEVFITNKDNIELQYLIEKTADNQFCLQEVANPEAQWGIEAETIEELFELLKQDKQDGLCLDYRIVQK